MRCPKCRVPGFPAPEIAPDQCASCGHVAKLSDEKRQELAIELVRLLGEAADVVVQLVREPNEFSLTLCTALVETSAAETAAKAFLAEVMR